MKPRVIPNVMPVRLGLKDLSKGDGLHRLRCVIRASWVRSLALLGMTAWFAWLFLPRPPLLDGISFSQCVRDRNGELLRVTLTSDQKFRIWTPVSQISPELIDATLQYAEKYFARHPGVNPIALARSGFGVLRGGARTGASTITMQVARLRFHLQTRTPVGKLRQIVRAL